MVALARSSTRMSVAEFLNWDSGDGQKWQLVDGEPRAMAPPSTLHAYLQAELAAVIRNHLRASNLPCDVFTNPGVIPATMAARNMRIPDLGVSCVPLADHPALADPVLLVEIISSSNSLDTWANVWAYTSIPSVMEILIIRPDAVAGELLRRSPDGSWPGAPAAVEGDLELESIGFKIALADLYARMPIIRT